MFFLTRQCEAHETQVRCLKVKVTKADSRFKLSNVLLSAISFLAIKVFFLNNSAQMFTLMRRRFWCKDKVRSSNVNVTGAHSKSKFRICLALWLLLNLKKNLKKLFMLKRRCVERKTQVRSSNVSCHKYRLNVKLLDLFVSVINSSCINEFLNDLTQMFTLIRKSENCFFN